METHLTSHKSVFDSEPPPYQLDLEKLFEIDLSSLKKDFFKEENMISRDCYDTLFSRTDQYP